MSEGTGSGEDVDREDGSDEDQFEEAANQVPGGAAGQAAQAASALALPEWAADLLARLAAGDRLDARDQPRLQLALDLRREHASAVQQEKAELECDWGRRLQDHVLTCVRCAYGSGIGPGASHMLRR